MNDFTSMCNENHDEVQDDQKRIDDHQDTTTPHIGQQFDSPDEAYNFYNEYARRIGFSIKIHYTNKHKYTKQVISRRFSCSKEGNRHFDKRDYLTTNPRAETKTECKAKMKISLLREPGKFKVCEFEPDHNHCLHLSSCAHMMRSQRQLDLAQKTEIDLANDSGIKPKETHEFMAKQSGGIDSLGHTRQDHKNYLRTKREQSLKYGEAGSLLKYFQTQLLENPSFYYAIQMDCEEQITNIFWADPKMIIDYAHFGDVVTFDTTFGTNKEYRPFGGLRRV